jgi:hypothetical protein
MAVSGGVSSPRRAANEFQRATGRATIQLGGASAPSCAQRRVHSRGSVQEQTTSDPRGAAAIGKFSSSLAPIRSHDEVLAEQQAAEAE